MVQILPSLSEQIGQQIRGLGKDIQNIIDPMHDAKEALAKRLITDPVFAQQYKDFVAQNPGAEHKDIGKRAQKMLDQMSESLESQNKRTVEKEISRQLTAPGSNAAAQAASLRLTGKDLEDREIKKYELENARELNNWMTDHRDLVQEGFMRKATGKTRFEYNLEKQSERSMEEAAGYIMQNPEQSIPQVIDGYFKGKLKPEILSGLLAHPRYGAEARLSVERYLKDQDHRWANNQRLLAGREARQMASDDRDQRLAYDIWKTTGEGTPEGHYRLLQTGAAGVEKLLNKSPDELTATERDMVESYQGQQKYRLQVKGQSGGSLGAINAILANAGGKGKRPYNVTDVKAIDDIIAKSGAHFKAVWVPGDGEKAPNIDLVNLDTGEHSLASEKGWIEKIEQAVVHPWDTAHRNEPGYQEKLKQEGAQPAAPAPGDSQPPSRGATELAALDAARAAGSPDTSAFYTGTNAQVDSMLAKYAPGGQGTNAPPDTSPVAMPPMVSSYVEGLKGTPEQIEAAIATLPVAYQDAARAAKAPRAAPRAATAAAVIPEGPLSRAMTSGVEATPVGKPKPIPQAATTSDATKRPLAREALAEAKTAAQQGDAFEADTILISRNPIVRTGTKVRYGDLVNEVARKAGRLGGPTRIRAAIDGLTGVDEEVKAALRARFQL